MTADAAALLRRSPYFSHFSDADLALAAKSVRLERASSGAMVVRQNDSTADAYFLASGKVRISRNTPYGRYTLAFLSAGDLFGEASFLDRRGRSGDVVAEGDAELIVLAAEPLAAACEQSTHFAVALHWAFWKSLSGKLRMANEQLLKFFTAGSGTPLDNGPSRRSSTGQFQVGMATKRQLFEEQKLSALEINFLTSLSKARKFSPGELIFREGEPGDRLYVVLEGQVRISKFIPGAGEEALAFLDRGNYFGEMRSEERRVGKEC